MLQWLHTWVANFYRAVCLLLFMGSESCFIQAFSWLLKKHSSCCSCISLCLCSGFLGHWERCKKGRGAWQWQQKSEWLFGWKMAIWKLSAFPNQKLSSLLEIGFIPSLPLTLFFNRANSSQCFYLHLTSVFPSSTVNLSWPSLFCFVSWAPCSEKLYFCWAFSILPYQQWRERGTNTPSVYHRRTGHGCPLPLQLFCAPGWLLHKACSAWMGEGKANCPSTMFLNPVCWGAGLQVMAQHREDLRPSPGTMAGQQEARLTWREWRKEGSFPIPFLWVG